MNKTEANQVLNIFKNISQLIDLSIKKENSDLLIFLKEQCDKSIEKISAQIEHKKKENIFIIFFNNIKSIFTQKHI